tara:strand:+ start:1343 stop:1744 length:402 start_codon:yes stop_codon:yes gene_type:complete
MTKDDLTPEEIEALAKINRGIWSSIEPRSIGKHNPSWVEAAKGTPLEDLSYPQIVDYVNSRTKPIVLKAWKDFSDGWIDAFGGRDIRPLKERPNAYLTEYLKKVSTQPSELKKGKEGATDWLLNRFIEERENG